LLRTTASSLRPFRYHQNNEKEQKEKEIGQMSKKRVYKVFAISVWVIGFFVITILLWEKYSPRAQTFGSFPNCNPADHGDCPYLQKQKP
jgi:hypothetical protein